MCQHANLIVLLKGCGHNTAYPPQLRSAEGPPLQIRVCLTAKTHASRARYAAEFGRSMANCVEISVKNLGMLEPRPLEVGPQPTA